MDKKCKKCKLIKNLNEFHSNGRNGKEANCRVCSIEIRKNKYNSDGEYREQKKRWHNAWMKRNFALKTEVYWKNRARKNSMRAFTPKQLQKVYEDSDKKCHYCHEDLSQKTFHFDHYIPGKQQITNLVIACPECNMVKSRMDGDAFKKFLMKFRTIP